MLDFSANVFFTIFSIVGSYYPKAVKYFTLVGFLQRCVMIFVMFRLIDGNISQRTDKKLLVDGITTAVIPWLGLYKIYPRMDFFLVPLVLVANYVIIQASLSQESGALDCFVEPAFFVQYMTTKQNFILVIMFFCSFINRKTDITLFSEQKLAKKQQTQLRNLFDQQKDGVLILQRKEQLSEDRPKQDSNLTEKHLCEPELSFDVNYAGSSFSSFVNPLETVNDEDMYEIVFQNDGLSSALSQAPLRDND